MCGVVLLRRGMTRRREKCGLEIAGAFRFARDAWVGDVIRREE